MRKRKNSEEEDSEMEIDDEQKMEHNEEDVDSEDEEAERRVLQENPFLDSFYGLSSEDPKIRSQAAQSMLQHCLLGATANSKDACYALRRLLNGVCSGRAAARQGNASALASFLKIAFHMQKMEEIREETIDSESRKSTLLAYVRERLIAATDPSRITGKKKGSEERDYQFGRLFGILAIVRSNILLPAEGSESNILDIIEVSSSLMGDLVDLFWLKKWIREPAAHGMTTLLKLFSEGKPRQDRQSIFQHLVQDVVVPKLLTKSSMGGDIESNHKILLENYCAEQVGIASFIQSHKHHLSTDDLPFPLDKAILTPETIPLIGQTLSETSVVAQPRTHFVWDTLWSYLTKPLEGATKNHNSLVKRQLRGKCPLGDASATDTLDALIRVVIVEKLLRLGKEKGKSMGKATHERRSLALCIVKNLSGVPFVSSTSGPIKIFLSPDAIENIFLIPDITRHLFLDVICAGSQKKQTTHLLKPLALDVLAALTEAISENGEDVESSSGRQLAVVRALLNCEIRFDARTKTSTVSDLLCFMDTIKNGTAKSMFKFWNDYLDFLETNLLEKCAKIDENDSSAEVTGYIELIYSAAKSIIRLEAESDADYAALKEYKETVMHRILGFFMASAFFNCLGLEGLEKGGRKDKGNKSQKNGFIRPILQSASKLQDATKESGVIPYAVRSIISARFFSLVSDFVHYTTHQTGGDHEGKTEKDSITLSILIDLCDNWKLLESSGAERFRNSTDSEKEDDDLANPDDVVWELRRHVEELAKSLEDDPADSIVASKKRCCTGITVLAYALYIHRLTCGEEEGSMEDESPDADEDEDEEEICNALDDLKGVLEDFVQQPDEETNPLLGLAELCANIMSSPIGSGAIGRGSSPKLVREAVKFAWLGGLRLSSTLGSKEKTLLDSSVIGVLLEAVGASSNEDAELENSSEEESDDEDEDDSSEDSDDEQIFSKASEVLGDTEDMDIDTPKAKPVESEDDSDIELDPSKLQSMLEEDSDADVDTGELEHHEGADAALAKLIKLKQEMRKAGQQAKEKIEISHQLRCTYLIELTIGKPDAWNRLFRSDVILKMVLPMLNHRKQIEKALMKSDGSKSGAGEKKALLERLTSLLRHKLCKMRLSSMPLESPPDLEYVSYLVSQIIQEARRSSNREHLSCCSSCLVFVLRSVHNVRDSISAAGACVNAITEWSTKRTQLSATLFEELIVHMPR